jgi:hypothetical protein
MSVELVFGVGDSVVVRREGGVYQAGVVFEVDPDDPTIPYAIQFEESGEILWIVMPEIWPAALDVYTAALAMARGVSVHATHAPSGAALVGRIYRIEVTLDHERVWVMHEGASLWADVGDVRIATGGEGGT